MADIQELITDLRIRDNLTVGLAKAKAEVSKFGNTSVSEAARTEKAFTGAADAIRGRFATLGADLKKGIGVGLGFGGVQLAAQGIRSITDGFQSAIDNARDLTETINKSKVVFGPAAAEIERFGETSATALGLSKNAAIGATAQFGNLFVSLGIGADKVAPMSTALVQLASDLASFNNISVAEALEKLQAGIVGEARPLRELGVAINEAAVSTEAARLGFKALAGQFTESEKVQARYSLILKLTGTAQGDFARTSGDLANQQRALDAQLEDVSAKLGKALIPLLTDVARILNNQVVPALASVGDNMDKIVPVAGALALIVGGKLALGLAASVKGLIASGIAAVQAADASTVLALAQEREALTANAAAVAQTELAAARVAAAGAGGVGATASSALAGAGAGRTAAAVAAGETLVGTAGGAAASGGLASFTAGLKAMVGQGLASIGMFNILHEAMVQDGTNTFAGVIAKKNLAQGFDALGRATTGLTPEIVAQSIAMGDSSRETLLSAKALAILAADTEQLKGSATSATPAEIALAKATIEASEAHRDLAEATRAATEAGPGNIAALAGMAEATSADELATAKLKATQDLLKVSMLGAENGTDTLSGSLVRGADAATIAASAYGLAADQIDRLRATAGKPFVAPPTIKIPGLEAGEGQPTGTGMTLAESFLDTLLLHNQNAAAAAALAAAKAAAAKAAAAEAQAARDKALSEAKAKAQERYNKTLQNTKDIATTLFDAQHARTLRAIKDTETLAQKQHDGALQQINDALKLKLETNAAPVTEAERRQAQIELARQRRDLAEALAQARRGGDPEAIRSAQEAIQSFQAQQGINALRLEQAKKDAAAQEEARIAQKAADDQLAAAKIASAKDIEAENLRNKTQRARFDKELEALKRRDAGASPAKLKADIAKLEEKFGITTDAKGFHHIADVLETVAKDLKPPLTGIGDAAAGATPGLAAVGASARTAADGLAVFTRTLGDLKVLELPVPKPVALPDIRQPVTALDQPRLSEAEILATAIKGITFEPTIMVQSTVNVTSPPIFLNGRLIAAALASSQSPAATPGIRTGTLSPRP